VSLLAVVLTIIAIGVLQYLVETWVGKYMSAPLLVLERIVVVVGVVIWLLNLAGLLAGLQTVQFPHR
jgi:hypothetical protein